MELDPGPGRLLRDVLFLFATARTAEPACIRSRFLTALYFLGLYLVGVAAGCLANLAVFPAEPPASERFYYLVITPAWVFALFGFLPAFFLGAAGHSILARLAKHQAQKVTEWLDAVYANEDSRLDPG